MQCILARQIHLGTYVESALSLHKAQSRDIISPRIRFFDEPHRSATFSRFSGGGWGPGDSIPSARARDRRSLQAGFIAGADDEFFVDNVTLY